MRSTSAFFDSLPLPIRKIIYGNLKIKDLASFSELNKKYSKEINELIVFKLAKESFYTCSPDEDPKLIYQRIEKLKKLFLETKYFKENFIENLVLTDNSGDIYKNVVKDMINKFPENEGIEIRLEKYVDGVSKFPNASLFLILYYADLYVKNDEHIILQTPSLIHFLCKEDFQLIFKSNGKFDKTAIYQFLRTPQLLSQFDLKLFDSSGSLMLIKFYGAQTQLEDKDYLFKVDSFEKECTAYVIHDNSALHNSLLNAIDPSPRGADTDIEDEILESNDDEFYLQSYRRSPG